jgi:hypothetical protein
MALDDKAIYRKLPHMFRCVETCGWRGEPPSEFTRTQTYWRTDEPWLSTAGTTFLQTNCDLNTKRLEGFNIKELNPPYSPG